MKLILRYFSDALKRFGAAFAAPFVLMMLMAGLSAIVPYLFRLFVGNLSDEIGFFLLGVALFALYLFLQTLIKMLWNYLLDGFGGKYIKYLSLGLQNSLLKTSFSDIDKNAESLKHTLYYDVLSIYSVVAVQFPMVLKSLVVTVAAVAVGFFFGAMYAAVILIAFLIGLAVSFASRKMIAGASRRTNLKMKENSAAASEFIDNLALAQLNGLGGYYAKKTERTVDDFIATAKREDLKTYFWHGIVQNYNQLFSIVLSALLAMPFAGSSVVNLVFFTMLADMIMTQDMAVQDGLLGIMKLQVCFENVDHILRFPQRKGRERPSSVREIAFERVSFSYGEGETALRGVSFRVKIGETVRIAGTNGSGKSTVAKLLCGLYAADSGEIRLNGQPIDSFLQSDLNAQILYLEQEGRFLNETAREHLSAIAGREIGEEEFSALCERTKFTEGNVTIGEEGGTLSPGQRKKLMMMEYLACRAQASVVILDEVFAGLDGEGREEFAKILCEDMRRREKIFLLIEHGEAAVPTDRTVAL